MLRILRIILIWNIIIIFAIKNRFCDCEETQVNHQELKPVCNNTECILLASRIHGWMNRNADPCRNFTDFVCGKFYNETVLNDRLRYVSREGNAKQKFLDQRRKVLASRIEDDDIDPFKLTKRFFSICTYTAAIDLRKDEPMFDLIESLGGWPLKDDSEWKEEQFDMVEIFRKHPSFIKLFYNINVTEDKIITITKPKILLGANIYNERYIIDDPSKKPIFLKYFLETVDLLIFNQSNTERQLEDVIDFLYSYNNNEQLKIYSSVAEFQNELRGDQISDIIDIILNDSLKGHVSKLVVDENYINFLSAALRTTKRTVANACLMLIIEASIQNLPKRYQKPYIRLRTRLDGTPKDLQRWQRCIYLTQNNFFFAVRALHAQQFLTLKRRNSIQYFFNHIRDDFVKKITEMDFKDHQPIKQEIISRINNFTMIAGCPDEVLDKRNLIDNYKHFLPIPGIGNRTSLISPDYLDPGYRKSNPLKGIQLFELALLTRDKSYLGQFRILNQPGLLDFREYWNIMHDIYLRKYSQVEVDSNILFLQPSDLHNDRFSSEVPNYFNYATLGYKIFDKLRHKILRHATKIMEVDLKQIIELSGSNLLNYGPHEFWDSLPNKKNIRSGIPGFEVQTPNQMFLIILGQEKCLVDRKSKHGTTLDLNPNYYRKDFNCV